MKPAATRQNGRRPYQFTGIYKLKAAVKQLEPRAIDGRSRAGKLRKALIEDMGGKSISAQSRILADAILKAKLFHKSRY
jgi:hypothetical protein